MCRNNFRDYGQTQTGPARRSSPRVLEAHEPFEYSFPITVGDAWTVIGDGDLCPIALSGHLGVDGGGRVPDGVVEEIAHDPGKLGGVAADLNGGECGGDGD